MQATDTLYSRNMRAIVNHLTKVHQFQLSSADILRMQHIYNAIYVYGPIDPVLDDDRTRDDGLRASRPTRI